MSPQPMHFYDNLAARLGLCGALGGDDDRHFYGDPSDRGTIENYARQFDRCLPCLRALMARPEPARGGR